MIVEEDEAFLHRVSDLLQCFAPSFHCFALILLELLEFANGPISDEAEVDEVCCSGCWCCEVLIDRPYLADIVGLKELLDVGVEPRFMSKLHRISILGIQV